MKIRYEFLTGETMEFEVPEDVGKVSIAIDKEIYNNDRRERRRHNSVNEMQEKGSQLADDRADIISLIEQKETSEALRKAFEKLLPQQRELIKKVFFEGKPMADIAREEGVDKSAISHRLTTIYQRMKKLLPE